ncbi:DUF397 domain-containing protein [Streptomyces sp. CA-181903]|uniref:DUF397 domain-containing protein n=1 Tax=Streptomyces sp. CA-181903 TaxID=3240055 RepID=UPI003D8FBAC4
MSTNHRRPAYEADPSGACWRKSSHSSGNGACVEVAEAGGIVAVRDSKGRSGPVLRFNPTQWAHFVSDTAERTAARN